MPKETRTISVELLDAGSRLVKATIHQLYSCNDPVAIRSTAMLALNSIGDTIVDVRERTKGDR